MARLTYLAVAVAVALGIPSRESDVIDADIDAGLSLPDVLPKAVANTACPVTVQSSLVGAYSPAMFACLPSLVTLAPVASGDAAPPRLADEGLRTAVDAEARAATKRTVLEAMNGSTCDSACVTGTRHVSFVVDKTRDAGVPPAQVQRLADGAPAIHGR